MGIITTLVISSALKISPKVSSHAVPALTRLHLGKCVLVRETGVGERVRKREEFRLRCCHQHFLSAKLFNELSLHRFLAVLKFWKASIWRFTLFCYAVSYKRVGRGELKEYMLYLYCQYFTVVEMQHLVFYLCLFFFLFMPVYLCLLYIN